MGDVRSSIYHVNIQNAVREYLQPQPCFSVLSEDIFPGSFEKHPKYYSVVLMVPLAGDVVVAVCLFNMSKAIYVAFQLFKLKKE